MTAERDWDPCPAGTIQDVTDSQDKATRATTLSRRALVVAAISSGTFLLWQQRPVRQPLQLTCQQVGSLAQKYAEGRLPADLEAAVASHCRICSPCEQHIAAVQNTSQA